MENSWADRPSSIIYGILLRGIGCLFLIAFSSLSVNIRDLIGKHGLRPWGSMVSRVSRDFSLLQRIWYWPSLFWILEDERFFLGMLMVGQAAACLVIYGGLAGKLALYVCFIIFLSFDPPVNVRFPWDCFLMDSAVLGFFLPTANTLPHIGLVENPSDLYTMFHKWLVFRLMIGFGKQKFTGIKAQDLNFLKGFVIAICPIPTRLSWYFYQLPLFVHIGSMGFLFVTEILLPFALFVPTLCPYAGAAFVFLMLGIQLTGNFGIFNVHTALFCIPLFFRSTSANYIPSFQDISERPIWHALLFTYVPFSVIAILGSSWLGDGPLYWPSTVRLSAGSRIFGWFVESLRVLYRFRLLHSYGVFPPYSFAPIRLVSLVEGSVDGITWKEYEWHYIPTNEMSTPVFIAPHHYRAIQFTIYDHFVLPFVDYFSYPTPYTFQHPGHVYTVGRHILEGSMAVKRLMFRNDPYPSSPPSHVRVRLMSLVPLSIRSHWRSGAWWQRKEVAILHQPFTLQNCNHSTLLGAPECFRWDQLYWRDLLLKSPTNWVSQTKLLPYQKRVQYDSSLTDDTLNAFWMLINGWGTDVHHMWSKNHSLLPKLRSQVLERMTLSSFESCFRRLSLLMYQTLEARLPNCCNFELELLANTVIIGGKQHYERTICSSDPPKYSAGVTLSLLESGFFLYAICWHEELSRQCISARVVQTISTMPRAYQSLPPFVPGIICALPLFKELCPSDAVTLPVISLPKAYGAWIVQSTS